MADMVVCDAGCAHGPGVLYPLAYGVKAGNVIAYDFDPELITKGIKFYRSHFNSRPDELSEILPDGDSFASQFVEQRVDMNTCRYGTQ